LINAAQFIMGACYHEGKEVPKNYAEAVKWYRKAAEQGEAVAQWHLGAFYCKGEGVQQDACLAYMWFNLAIAQGFKTAIMDKEMITERMSMEQIAEAQKMSREWLQKREKEE